MDDLPAITRIQNAFIAEEPIEWTHVPHTIAGRARWLDEHEERGFPVVVAVDGEDGPVLGWAAYGDFRDSLRWPGYRYTVEHTVHVDQAAWGRGVGRVLMLALMDHARRAGRHVMVGAVTGENVASIEFHRRLGFVEVGRMPQVGAKLGRWLDLVLLQKALDDRDRPSADPD